MIHVTVAVTDDSEIQAWATTDARAAEARAELELHHVKIVGGQIETFALTPETLTEVASDNAEYGADAR